MSIWKARRYFTGAEIIAVVLCGAVCLLMAGIPARHIDPVISGRDADTDDKQAGREDQYPLSPERFSKILTSEAAAQPKENNTQDTKIQPRNQDVTEERITRFYKLKGTYTDTGSPERSCAVVAGNKEPGKLLYPGDVINVEGVGSIALASVSYDAVQVKDAKTGKVFTLTIEEPHKTAHKTVDRKRNRNVGPRTTRDDRSSARLNMHHNEASAGIRRIRPNKYTIPKEAMDPYRARPEKLFSEISVRPQTKNGEPTGSFIITGMRSDALLKKVGLRQGDVITRVNGQSPLQLMQLLNDPSLTDVTVDYQRGGRNQRLHFTLQK